MLNQITARLNSISAMPSILTRSLPSLLARVLKRMAFNAGSEVGRFFPIVCIGGSLTGRCSLFKHHSIPLDEGHESSLFPGLRRLERGLVIWSSSALYRERTEVAQSTLIFLSN
jgi:hypothetical protein